MPLDDILKDVPAGLGHLRSNDGVIAGASVPGLAG